MTDIPVFAVIMAGGLGTRLWPLSREGRPKQFLTLSGSGQSLLQEAVRRARIIVGSIHQVLITTQARYASLVKEQLPELPAENLIVEPVGRNTAPCLGLVALHMLNRLDQHPDAIMAVFSADQLFPDEVPWLEAVKEAIAFARQADSLVAIGIPPTEPSTSYGYLHLGKFLRSGVHRLDEISEIKTGQLSAPVYQVRKFVEKPSVEIARYFYESGEYLWNTGTFAWRLSIFWNNLRELMPELYEGLAGLGWPVEMGRLEEVYPNFEMVSVDYGVMEKAKTVTVVQGNFRRIDVGSLGALSEIWPLDLQCNSVLGKLLSRDSQDNIVCSDEGLVGLIGVKDMIVIRLADVLLVCPRARAAEVKALVEELGREGLEQYL